MRRRPPAATLEWVARTIGPGARITRIRRLRNAWAAAVHAVDVEHDGARHALVLRRWVRNDLPPDEGVIANESTALRLAAAIDTTVRIATPALVAVDEHAEHTDVPAVLMTRVPGRVELAPADLDGFLDEMSDALHAIHAVHPPPADALAPYDPWIPEAVEPPSWAPDAAVWEAAIAIARRPVPDLPFVFCHRDFHPGNVLWRRSRVSAVVDWTHTCLAPAAADLAHCRMNLAVLFGLDAADDFADRYGPVDALAWFDVTHAVSGSGEPNDAWRWADAGRTDITTELLRARMDEFVRASVSRCA